MSKKVTYTCELCGDTRDESDLHGVYFIDCGVSFEFRRASDCNRHVCKWCVAGIVANYDKQLKGK